MLGVRKHAGCGFLKDLSRGVVTNLGLAEKEVLWSGDEKMIGSNKVKERASR